MFFLHLPEMVEQIKTAKMIKKQLQNLILPNKTKTNKFNDEKINLSV